MLNCYTLFTLLYLFTPFGAPVGVIALKFSRDFWRRKTRIPWLSYGVVYVILGLAIYSM